MSPETMKTLRGTPQFLSREHRAITEIRNTARDADLDFDPDDVIKRDLGENLPPVRLYTWKSADGRALETSVVYDPYWLEAVRG